MGWDEAWAGLDEAWRRAFVLAWDAFAEGSIAVGAVVLGVDGEVIAEGRNRHSDPTPPAGQVGGSLVAHAEVNALARLPVGTPGPTTLLTTLEPCFLCTAASRYAHIAIVRYPAVDPAWAGVERMGELNATFARQMSQRELVYLGPFTPWAGALPLISLSTRVARREGRAVRHVLADNPFVETTRAVEPGYACLAEALVEDGLAPGTGLSLERALARWWPVIEPPPPG